MPLLLPPLLPLPLPALLPIELPLPLPTLPLSPPLPLPLLYHCLHHCRYQSQTQSTGNSVVTRRSLSFGCGRKYDTQERHSVLCLGERGNECDGCSLLSPDTRPHASRGSIWAGGWHSGTKGCQRTEPLSAPPQRNWGAPSPPPLPPPPPSPQPDKFFPTVLVPPPAAPSGALQAPPPIPPGPPHLNGELIGREALQVPLADRVLTGQELGDLQLGGGGDALLLQLRPAELVHDDGAVLLVEGAAVRQEHGGRAHVPHELRDLVVELFALPHPSVALALQPRDQGLGREELLAGRLRVLLQLRLLVHGGLVLLLRAQTHRRLAWRPFSVGM